MCLAQDIDGAVATYLHLSERWFTHASPTLFNAGTPRPQLSSCFLIAMKVFTHSFIVTRTVSECLSHCTQRPNMINLITILGNSRAHSKGGLPSRSAYH